MYDCTSDVAVKASTKENKLSVSLTEAGLTRVESKELRQRRQVFVVVKGVDGLPKGRIEIAGETVTSRGDNCIWVTHQNGTIQGFNALVNKLIEAEGHTIQLDEIKAGKAATGLTIQAPAASL
jgi:hypothetical protein